MARMFMPRTQVQVVPKEGAIEIILNINVTVDGKAVTAVPEAPAADEPSPFVVPEFRPGSRINFGKKE